MISKTLCACDFPPAETGTDAVAYRYNAAKSKITGTAQYANLPRIAKSLFFIIYHP